MTDLAGWAQSTGPLKPAQDLDDVDEVAVERACQGDRTVTLNRAEMALAFLWLDEHGYSHRRIAAILGVTDRTVSRWRSRRDFPYSRPSDHDTKMSAPDGKIGHRQESTPGSAVDAADDSRGLAS